MPVECRNWETGAWQAAPTCKETGKALGFTFGVDNFLYCGVEVKDAAFVAGLKRLVTLDSAWHCRLLERPGGSHTVPFTLPAWGVVESGALHLDNHLHVVLHADAGAVVAAGAYALRDRFQFVQPGVTLSLHGPVRWFDKATFTPLAGAGGAAGDAGRPRPRRGEGVSPLAVLAWCGATATATAAGAAALYVQRLKPAVIRKCLKAR